MKKPAVLHLKLTHAATIIPNVVALEAGESPRVAPAGAIVRMENFESTRSPLGDKAIAISYLEANGQRKYGWLWSNVAAEVTARGAKTSMIYHNTFGPDRPPSAIDAVLRLGAGVYLAHQRTSRPGAWWPWLVQLSRNNAPDFAKVVRDLGLRVRSSDDHLTMCARIIAAIINVPVEEIDMSTAVKETAQPTAKRSTKKKAVATKPVAVAKSTKAETDGALRGAPRIGAELVSLLDKGEARKLARSLAEGGTLKKKELLTLRDGINTAASVARENNDGSTASKLSACNRVIRRLSREA